MTLFGEIFPPRTAACLTIVSTSVEVSWANAGETKLSAAKIRSARSFIGTVLIRCIIDCRSCSQEGRSVGLLIRGNFGHPRPPMRWSTWAFTGANRRALIASLAFFSVGIGHNTRAQSVEINSARDNPASSKHSTFPIYDLKLQPIVETKPYPVTQVEKMLEAIDPKDVLSLEPDLVLANTTLIAAENEPLSPSEFNPDPGA